MKKQNNPIYQVIRLLQVTGLAMLALTLTHCKNEVLSDSANPEKFNYLASEDAPFNYSENGQASGFSVDLLEALFNSMALPLDRANVEMTDWTAAYEKTENEPCNMLLSLAKTTGRDTLFKWVGPITSERHVVIALSGSGVSVTETSDLNGYFTGIVQNDDIIDLLLKGGVMRANILLYDNPLELYKALADTREIQCIAYSLVNHNLMVQTLDKPAGTFVVPYTIQTDELYYAFNAETDDDLITSFQNAFDSLKQGSSGEYHEILNRYNEIKHGTDNITEEMVTTLVDRTAIDLASDAPGTINKINQGLAPYKDATNPALCAFVFDKDVKIVAQAQAPASVGSSMKGIADVTGKAYRDEMVAGALSHGTGWTDYVYTKRDAGGLFFMAAYYKLVIGSDSKQYVVCSKRYK